MKKKKNSKPTVTLTAFSEDDVAKATHSQHIAFIEAGFTSEQAFELTKLKFANLMQTSVTIISTEE